ncbi:MAG: hypothetical protein ACJ762_03690 [Solirubrobacteraceae bacterium]
MSGLALPLRRAGELTERGRTAIRLTALAVAVIAVHAPPLLITLRELHRPLVVAPVLVPLLLAVAYAVVVHVTRGHELAIHDRHVDLMVAVTCGGLGVVTANILHSRLGTLDWSLRLDLLGLPVFVLGAASLLFGARATWRFRWPIVTAAATGPLLGLLVVLGPRGVTAGCAALTLAVAGASVRRVLRRRPNRTTFGVQRIGRSWGLLAALVALGLALAVSRDALPEAPDSGVVRVTDLPAGWTVRASAPVALPTSAGDIAWRRTLVAGPLPPPAANRPRQAVIDVLSDPSRLRLAGLSLAAVYAFDGDPAPGARAITLDGGVPAQVGVWQNEKSRLTWTTVDFMLHAGDRYERVVVIVTDERKLSARIFPAPADEGAGALLDGLVALVRGTPNELVAGRRLEPKNLDQAVDLANRTVREARS